MDNLPMAPEDATEELALGDLRQILLNNEFDSAMAELTAEMNEVEELYKSTKNHTLDLMKTLNEDQTPRRMNTQDGRKKISTIYITSQMSNLVSLKSLKMSMLKERNGLYASRLDRAFKIVTQMTKDKRDGNGNNDLPYDTILGFLLNAGVTVPVSPTSLGLPGTLDRNEDDIDNELLGIAEKENLVVINTTGKTVKELEAEKNAELVESDHLATRIYYDSEEEKIYLVTDDYTVIRELEESVLDLVEDEEENLFCNNFNLPVEQSE